MPLLPRVDRRIRRIFWSQSRRLKSDQRSPEVPGQSDWDCRCTGRLEEVLRRTRPLERNWDKLAGSWESSRWCTMPVATQTKAKNDRWLTRSVNETWVKGQLVQTVAYHHDNQCDDITSPGDHVDGQWDESGKLTLGLLTSRLAHLIRSVRHRGTGTGRHSTRLWIRHWLAPRTGHILGQIPIIRSVVRLASSSIRQQLKQTN